MGARDIVDCCLDLNEMVDEHFEGKPGWWVRGWIPFFETAGGDNICIDTSSPASFDGTTGQIIEFWHADADRNILAPDFATWLDALVTEFEAGLFHDEDGDGGARTSARNPNRSRHSARPRLTASHDATSSPGGRKR